MHSETKKIEPLTLMKALSNKYSTDLCYRISRSGYLFCVCRLAERKLLWAISIDDTRLIEPDDRLQEIGCHPDYSAVYPGGCDTLGATLQDEQRTGQSDQDG